MLLLYLVVVVATSITLINGLTHPLPAAENSLKHELIKCGTGKEFQWDRTDPVGNDIAISYQCGKDPQQTKTFSCKNGYKASSKRDNICNPGPDPNFGIFREGKDPNIMDSARIVYFCMKESANTLPPCK